MLEYPDTNMYDDDDTDDDDMDDEEVEKYYMQCCLDDVGDLLDDPFLPKLFRQQPDSDSIWESPLAIIAKKDDAGVFGLWLGNYKDTDNISFKWVGDFDTLKEAIAAAP